MLQSWGRKRRSLPPSWAQRGGAAAVERARIVGLWTVTFCFSNKWSEAAFVPPPAAESWISFPTKKNFNLLFSVTAERTQMISPTVGADVWSSSRLCHSSDCQSTDSIWSRGVAADSEQQNLSCPTVWSHQSLWNFFFFFYRKLKIVITTIFLLLLFFFWITFCSNDIQKKNILLFVSFTPFFLSYQCQLRINCCSQILLTAAAGHPFIGWVVCVFWTSRAVLPDLVRKNEQQGWVKTSPNVATHTKSLQLHGKR